MRRPPVRGTARPARIAAPNRGTLWLLLASALLSPPAQAESADYAPQGKAWNGLSKLFELAERIGVEIEAPSDLDTRSLSSSDGLLIVHPTRRLPRIGLSAFMRSGGRVAIADDFGRGDELLRAFRIARRAPGPPADDRRLRGNAALIIATPESGHPLTTGVSALVTNHPQRLWHTTLDPVFSLADEGEALVLSGAVGAGRLVALGDPSVLINNMLGFRGNYTFGGNLLRYLAGEHNGRVLIVSGATPVRDGSELDHPHPLDAIRKGLSTLGELPLPARAVRAATWVVTLSLLLAALSALPRSTASERALPLSHRPTTTGFPGQVAALGGARGNGLTAETLLRYGDELERSLATALGLAPATGRAQILGHLEQRAGAESRARCASLLSDLDDLRRQGDTGPPRTSQARFQSMVEAGQAILESLRT